MKMDIFDLFFHCHEEGKGEHCVYCWFGPQPGCPVKLYREFKRQVRGLLCPFEMGQRVFVIKQQSTYEKKLKLLRGFVYRLKNEGKGWKIYVRNENGEYIGAFNPNSLGKTIFKSKAEAERVMRSQLIKRKGQDDAELS